MTTAPSMRKRKLNCTTMFLKRVEERDKQRKAELQQNLKKKNEKDDVGFFKKSVTISLKKLLLHLRPKGKIEILNVVNQSELFEITQTILYLCINVHTNFFIFW